MRKARAAAPAPSERGFALVELLVALALLALMMVLLLTAFYGSRRALDAAERRQIEPSIEAAQSLLRDLLSAARAVGTKPGGEAPPAFAGESTHATFTTLFEKRGQYAGLYRVRIALSPSNTAASQSLVVELELHRPDFKDGAPPAASRTRHVLLEGVETLRLSYFGRRGGEEIAHWHSSWNGQTHLPSLVWLQITPAPGSRRRFPDLVVQLALAGRT